MSRQTLDLAPVTAKTTQILTNSTTFALHHPMDKVIPMNDDAMLLAQDVLRRSDRTLGLVDVTDQKPDTALQPDCRRTESQDTQSNSLNALPQLRPFVLRRPISAVEKALLRLDHSIEAKAIATKATASPGRGLESPIEPTPVSDTSKRLHQNPDRYAVFKSFVSAATSSFRAISGGSYRIPTCLGFENFDWMTSVLGRDPLEDVSGTRVDQPAPVKPVTEAAVSINTSHDRRVADRRALPRRPSQGVVAVCRQPDAAALVNKQERFWLLHATQLKGRLEEVSMNGTAFLFPEPIDKGQEVLLRITDRQQRVSVDVVGTVLRSSFANRDGWRVVCRFRKKLSFELVNLFGQPLFQSRFV